MPQGVKASRSAQRIRWDWFRLARWLQESRCLK